MEPELRFADLVLNDATHEVWRGSSRVDLTPREFDLLRFFLLNPRRVLSKQQILDRVWDDSFRGDPNIVETYISYLRRKLEPHGPPLIHTVRLVGYALREADA
jgi:two-component system, OmpR family, response regulator